MYFRREKMNNEKVVKFKDYAAPDVHKKVFEILKKEKKGTLLDIPAGEGHAVYHLKKMGYDVTAGDILPDNFKAPGIKCVPVDLNRELPFEDTSFDCISCIEGIEHIENPHLLIRECARLLVDDGILVLTTPNILNVFSRLRFMLVGKFEKFGDRFLDQNNFFDLHITALPFDILLFILTKVGFSIESITTNRNIVTAQGNLFLRVLLFKLGLFIRLITLLRKRRDPLLKRYITDELLYGEIVILKCRKVGCK